MADPLAQFRKKSPPAAPGDDGNPTATEEYVAFGAKDRVTRLRIRRASAPTRAPGYTYLLDVVYDGSYGTNFVLVFTFLMVMVRGRNLQPVIAALENGMADFIQEFDSDRWQRPRDETTPFIESVEVVVQESAASVSGAETGKQQIGH